MKITQLVGYEVVVPAYGDRVNSSDYGPAIFDETSKLIFEMHTDEGVVGLGETSRGVGELALNRSVRFLKDVEITSICFQEPQLYDLSENDMFAYEHPSKPHRVYEQPFSHYTKTGIGIHSALLDLLGKKTGLPVCALMGGAYRDRISVDYWMGRMTPEDSARVCKAAKEKGYLGVKSKCALEDDNAERAQAVADACGSDFKITFDPNERFYRYAEAIDMLKELSKIGNVGCIEDPFIKDDLESYRLLRQQGLFPVALHLNYSPELIRSIGAQACDYINLSDIPWNVLRGGGICWVANIPTWHGSGLDLGILEALYLHTCAATKSMTRPSDILARNIRQHNLITNKMPIENGTIAVPTGAGLGVELDRDALDRYTRRTFTIQI